MHCACAHEVGNERRVIETTAHYFGHCLRCLLTAEGTGVQSTDCFPIQRAFAVEALVRPFRPSCQERAQSPLIVLPPLYLSVLIRLASTFIILPVYRNHWCPP